MQPTNILWNFRNIIFWKFIFLKFHKIKKIIRCSLLRKVVQDGYPLFLSRRGLTEGLVAGFGLSAGAGRVPGEADRRLLAGRDPMLPGLLCRATGPLGWPGDPGLLCRGWATGLFCRGSVTGLPCRGWATGLVASDWLVDRSLAEGVELASSFCKTSKRHGTELSRQFFQRNLFWITQSSMEY